MKPEESDYPFGFGFSFMRNRRALERFNALSDREQRCLLRRLARLHTQGEREAWIRELDRRD